MTSSVNLYASHYPETELDDYYVKTINAKSAIIAFEALDFIIKAHGKKQKINIEMPPKALIEPKTNLSSFQKSSKPQNPINFILGDFSAANKAKPLIAPKINGVLMLHRPEDCPGYQEDFKKYELPERDVYYAKHWTRIDQEINSLYSK